MSRRHEIANLLRARLTTMLAAGALKPGDRLASTRELSQEFNVDPRVVQAAYRELKAEGLVEVRPRSGMFAAQRNLPPDTLEGLRDWLIETAAHAIDRGIPASRIPQILHDALSRRPFHAVTIATSVDQNEGMCRELREDFGIRTSCITMDELDGNRHESLAKADLVVTTEQHAKHIRRIAQELGKPVVVVAIRNDLVSGVWRQLLREPIYVVVADPRFVPIVRKFFANTPGAHNLRPIVLGQDDPAQIPTSALVYITAGARLRLRGRKIRGRLIPNARVFSPESTRQILKILVAANAPTTRHTAQKPVA